jgi:hypothetical protein
VKRKLFSKAEMQMETIMFIIIALAVISFMVYKIFEMKGNASLIP